MRCLCFLTLVGWILWAVPPADAEVKRYLPREPYEAPPYVPPPPLEPHNHFIDNGDGTLTDDSGLMWAQADSYADLGQCLSWHQSQSYIQDLNSKKFAGYSDWRMPTLFELVEIYDAAWDTVMAHDMDPENPLHLDPVFAKGSAYWFWTADAEFTKLTDCCARSFYFVTGMTFVRRFSTCANGGVRPVRGVVK